MIEERWKVVQKEVLGMRNSVLVETVWGVGVCLVGRVGPEKLKNAHIIAAAPRMYAELDHLVKLLEPYEQSGLQIAGLATLNKARAVLAEARGEAQ